jgi:3-dehydroquinate synthase
VVCDTLTLNSLPESVFLDGLGEIAKYAVLDPKIYQAIKDGDCEMRSLIALSVDYKRRIVEEDEFEIGNRKLLNLGHTIAHAIEKLSNLKITHGRAVAIGVGVVLDLSFKHGFIDEKVYQDIKGVVNKLVGDCPCPFSMQEIVSACLVDKKRTGDYITLVTVHGVGDCRFLKVKVSELLEFFK